MPTQKRTTTSTFDDAQDAARKIFHEAANAWPAVRRFDATKSKHFHVIERLDPASFADLLAWLFLLDQKVCPDRWIAFGPNASDQLLSYCYPRLSQSSDDSLARLMDGFRAREFSGHSSSDIVALLQAFIKRSDDHPLSDRVLADVEAFIGPNGPWPIYSRVAKIRQRESQNRREMKRLYRELLKAHEPDGHRPKQAPRKP